MSVHPLDHLVLPVADLKQARARLTALGFTVAPDGHHPFGTSNCCIYFENGTFIEPLAVTDDQLAKTAAANDNLFVGRDQLFRSAAGNEGLSALVLLTTDALADHASFIRDGVSAGPTLDFSRPFVDAQGVSDEAKFRLAFAAEPSAPAAYFFTCERVRSPKVDRSALQRHANGAIRPSRAIWAVSAPKEVTEFWTAFLGAAPENATVEAVDYELSNATASVWTADRLLEQYGVIADGLDHGMQAQALVFDCANLETLRHRLDVNSVAHQVKGKSIIVPPAPGQGVAFIFESSHDQA